MKRFLKNCSFVALFLILCATMFFLFVPEARTVVYQEFFKGNILIGGKVHVVGIGIETMRISAGATSSSMIRIDSPGSPLLGVTLESGAAEIGTTIGYASVGDDEDFLRFTVQLPDNWLDLGNAADLEFEFYISEQGGTECNIDVRIFEFNNATPIVTDTIAITNGAAAGWVNLVTLSTGIGADTDIGPGDTLMFEMTSTADADDWDIYGVRMKYSIGLEKVS